MSSDRWYHPDFEKQWFVDRRNSVIVFGLLCDVKSMLDLVVPAPLSPITNEFVSMVEAGIAALIELCQWSCRLGSIIWSLSMESLTALVYILFVASTSLQTFGDEISVWALIDCHGFSPLSSCCAFGYSIQFLWTRHPERLFALWHGFHFCLPILSLKRVVFSCPLQASVRRWFWKVRSVSVWPDDLEVVWRWFGRGHFDEEIISSKNIQKYFYFYWPKHYHVVNRYIRLSLPLTLDAI